MRVLMVLTYYRPHTSGLTLYAQRLAQALVGRGHSVTVLASRHLPDLPREASESAEAGEKGENAGHDDNAGNSVRVVRSPVWFRFGKGVISPALYRDAARLVKSHDVVLLHLPQFDSAGIALIARLCRRPVVITYHCDLQLPPGAGNRVVGAVVRGMNAIAGRLAQRVVAYTGDFASHSPFLRRFARKVAIIAPPVKPAALTPESSQSRSRTPRNRKGPVIGMAARFAAEKGIEVLLDALPLVLQAFPDARVSFAGQYEAVWGEQNYFERLAPRVREFQAQGRFRFLGVLAPQDMPAFYDSLDVLVVPSLNNTESFGLVQIEAMQRGCPVIASDLPGVREPVRITGMGRIVPVGNASALAAAIREAAQQPAPAPAHPGVFRQFDPDVCAASYEALFETVRNPSCRG